MKINDNLLAYTVITEMDNNKYSWKIDSNIGENGYYTPALENLLLDFYADSDKWILEKLLPNLKILLTYKESTTITGKDIHEAITFELEELQDIPKKDYQTIVDLIEQAIKLGFFKEYYGRGKR